MDATCESTTDLLLTLRRHFGHPGFRPGQEQVVAAVLGGRDVLAVMPTGSGKSLGYQLPALILPGLTLVVSPLISLMKDQVDELERRGIPSGALHSMLPAAAKREVLAAARAGALRLLYVAPERFASDEFVRLLAGLTVARFVIDEAHCVSEWGHDFRPDYRRLRAAAAACRPADSDRRRPPIAAFTATATGEVRDDIVELLGLDSPQVLVAGFDRPNIHLRVERVAGEWEKNELLPRLVCGRRALVYAATRRTAESAAKTLADAGVDAAAYHAGLKDDERTRVQDAFAAGALRVVCATNAFGMGIDRPDVDAVVHFAIPGSLEAYYQEIGRAGRDGRPATATLLWDYDDVRTREFLIDQPARGKPGRPPLDPAELERRKAIDHRRLEQMIAYAETSGCLRGTILSYFGDPAATDRCRSCGNCDPGGLDGYERQLVRTILSAVAQAGERYGRRRIVALLAGALEDLPPPLRVLPTAGALRHESSDAIGRWVDAALGAGLLEATADQYRTLALTETGRAVAAGRADPRVMRPPRPMQVAAWRHLRTYPGLTRRRGSRFSGEW
ncbi:MAG TPA: ATP-dependent DNA helicase RecQ [Vicinamibacterales bacterium]|nr:ATP-dependent DNA helicase RecQ [Vicinamibacterales bacterium]